MMRTPASGFNSHMCLEFVGSLLLGPFLESPETLWTIFGCHNSLIPRERRGFKSSNFTVSLLFVILNTP